MKTLSSSAVKLIVLIVVVAVVLVIYFSVGSSSNTLVGTKSVACDPFTLLPKIETGDDITTPIKCSFSINKQEGIAGKLWSFEISKNTEGNTVASINDESGKFIQSIVIGIGKTAPGDAIVNFAYDVNFDGYTDMRIVSEVGASNVFFDYWIFSPTKNMFEKSSVLNHIPGAVFDSGNKTIRGTLLQGVNPPKSTTYEFINGKYSIKK